MRPPPLRVVNVGGSLTTALVLSAVAWGVRLLRAKNILRPAERPTKPAARASSKALFGRLSPLAFRLLLELEAVPFVLVDVRTAEEAGNRPLSSLLGSRVAAVQLPEAELPMVLRRPGAAWEQRFGSPCPRARQTLVFLSGNGAAAVRCASIAANMGFLRCAVLDGGLEALGGGGASRAPRFTFISRQAVALLLRGGGSGMVPGEGGPLLLDVRRCDERVLYGAIPGAAHLPAEQLPRALAMGTEEWSRTFRFPKPLAADTLIFHSRSDRRARWAAQLATDAGLERCLVLRDGVSGWRFDTCVKLYEPYQECQPPPQPQPFELEEPDLSDADEELYGLSLM